MSLDAQRLSDAEIQKLYNEENLALLRDIHKAIKRLALDPMIKVEAPTVNLEPTPVVVEQKEVVISNEELIEVLSGIKTLIEQDKPIEVSNLKDYPTEISITNLKTVEQLLTDLLQKDATVTVKAGDVNVSFPTSNDATKYIPVRLTDGKDFYNAVNRIAAVASVQPIMFLSSVEITPTETELEKRWVKVGKTNKDNITTLTIIKNKSTGKITKEWS